MAEHSSTLIGNRIGLAMLRVSGAYTEADIQRARQQDWIWRRWQRASSSADPFSTDEFIALTNDECATGSEFEAARRAVARAGDALVPPSDWVDDYSVFSAERLAADELDAARAAPTH